VTRVFILGICRHLLAEWGLREHGLSACHNKLLLDSIWGSSAHQCAWWSRGSTSVKHIWHLLYYSRFDIDSGARLGVPLVYISDVTPWDAWATTWSTHRIFGSLCSLLTIEQVSFRLVFCLPAVPGQFSPRPLCTFSLSLPAFEDRLGSSQRAVVC
jgi:hypothetical protein